MILNPIGLEMLPITYRQFPTEVLEAVNNVLVYVTSRYLPTAAELHNTRAADAADLHSTLDRIYTELERKGYTIRKVDDNG